MTFGESSTSHGAPLRVAFDTGPMLSARTGIGEAVAMMHESLRQRQDIALHRYVCSFRGQLPEQTTRLPIPAAIAQRCWARGPYPRVDRWLTGADVIHGTNYVVPPSRKPRLVSVYDCWFLRHPASASAAVTLAGRVLTKAVHSGATIHATSQATAQAARELLNTDRVEVIALAALPVDLAAPGTALQVVGDTPFIVAVGTLERRKNLPVLVAAFAAVAHVHPDLRLVLAGAAGDDTGIATAIAALTPSTRARVLIVGSVTPAHKQWLLHHASVLAYPSLDEGFGFPLLEAMQYQLPIVASTSGSIPEVAGAAALLVAHHDVEGLSAALLRALDDSALRATLIADGVAQVNRFSWADTAEKLADLYRRLQQEGY